MREASVLLDDFCFVLFCFVLLRTSSRVWVEGLIVAALVGLRAV